MTRIAKILVRFVAALIAFVVIGIAVEFIANLRTEKAAEALLRDVQRLKVGQSTEADIERIIAENKRESRLDHFNICSPSAETHRTEIDNRTLNWLGYQSKILRPLGNRIWTVDAYFVVDKGRLCFVRYVLRTLDTQYALEITSGSIAEEHSEIEPYQLSVGTHRNIRFLRPQVTTLATEEEHQHTFDLDLSCLSHFGGCRSVCELMPSAWLDYQKKAKEKGWDIPAYVLADPCCNNH